MNSHCTKSKTLPGTRMSDSYQVKLGSTIAGSPFFFKKNWATFDRSCTGHVDRFVQDPRIPKQDWQEAFPAASPPTTTTTTSAKAQSVGGLGVISMAVNALGHFGRRTIPWWVWFKLETWSSKWMLSSIHFDPMLGLNLHLQDFIFVSLLFSN